MDSLVQADNVVLQARATRRDHDIDAEVLSKHFAYLGSLQCQFSGGHKHESLNLAVLGIHTLQGRNDKCGRLAGAVLCSCQDVSSGEGDGYSFFLNWRRLLETSFEDAHEKFAIEIEILPLETFCGSDILIVD